MVIALKKFYTTPFSTEKEQQKKSTGQTFMENTQLRTNINQNTARFKEAMLAGSWWHSIDLGDGYVTPGVHSFDKLTEIYQLFGLPEDLTGRRALDIGCWDGFYSFEMERHGASVVSVDCWRPENFFRAREALGSKAEFHELSVYDVTRERLGSFDVVLFLGVLYHLRHPLLGLEQVCEVTRDVAIISSHVIDNFYTSPRPIMEFYEIDELGGQYDNWWGPNVDCLTRMLRAAGFARTEFLRQETTHAFIKAYRTWNDRPGESTPSLRIVDIINATSYDHQFPVRGGKASLALSVEGLPAATTREEVRVEVGGFGIAPVYVGQWVGSGRTDQFQINVPVPPGLDPGRVEVRLWRGAQESQPYPIELIPGTQW